MGREVGSAPAWAPWVTWPLAFVGLGISTYLTITHFDTAIPIACSDKGIVNCALVTSSPQSYIFGIPVAVLGLVQYVAMAVLCSPWMWRSTRYWVAVARPALAVVGMGFVLWLVAAELLIIDHICLWCTGVHVVTFLLLVALAQASPRQFSRLVAQ